MVSPHASHTPPTRWFDVIPPDAIPCRSYGLFHIPRLEGVTIVKSQYQGPPPLFALPKHDHVLPSVMRSG